ncbi:MAG: CpaF family protein [Lachnospiraceae bacterium]|nr:CpaF family protein [Lachnospiraceae bacterium]
MGKQNVSCSEAKEKIKEQVMLSIDMTAECDDALLEEIIDSALADCAWYIPYRDKVRIKKEIYNSLRRFDVLSELLEDDDITDIMVNGTSDIYIDKNGIMQASGLRFDTPEKLENIIQHIVAGHNRVVNETNPIVDVRMEDGSRVNIVLPPVAINGPAITIRKFPKLDFTMDRYIEMGTISHEAAKFLKTAVIAGYNIFISGGTGSGKTTLLNVLSGYIPRTERIITIEDSAELRIQGIDNIVRLETRNANLEGKNEITMSDLIKSSLRMVPSRIIVGEVRGVEALDMMQAMNTGHDGSLSTGHANSAKDMISRLETLVLTARDFPMEAIRRQIASALDIIVHLGRLRDRARRVLEISEVLYSDREIVLNPLFQYDDGAENGGCLVKTANHMHNTDKLVRKGFE